MTLSGVCFSIITDGIFHRINVYPMLRVSSLKRLLLATVGGSVLMEVVEGCSE